MSRYVLNAEQEALYRASYCVTRPSQPAPWEGIYDRGQRYTQHQLRKLREMGLDPSTIDYLEAEVPGQPDRIYITARQGLTFGQVIYFYRRVPCPIIGTRADRLKVVAPDGSAKLVYPNGQLKRRTAR